MKNPILFEKPCNRGHTYKTNYKTFNILNLSLEGQCLQHVPIDIFSKTLKEVEFQSKLELNSDKKISSNFENRPANYILFKHIFNKIYIYEPECTYATIYQYFDQFLVV